MSSLTGEYEIRALDLFSGAGGGSLGARLAGIKPVAAIDMWTLARDTYRDNFPGTIFYRRKAQNVRPEEVAQAVGGPIQLLLASPECSNHTCARGAKKKSDESRNTAFQVTRFARVLKPRWIVVENVIQMKSWRRYSTWLSRLRKLGYHVREQTLNAADFGVAQSRRRLFVLCDLKVMPPKIVPPTALQPRTARDVIDPKGGYSFSALRNPKRATATIDRADRALAALSGLDPFLIVYYGSDAAGGWQRVDRPLRTVTTLDRFAYVRPTDDGQHEMRMLQVPELKEAMGFPVGFRLDHGTRRERVKLLGNAICPPVMKSIVEALVRQPITEAFGNTQAATPTIGVVKAEPPELSLAEHP